MDHRLYQQEAIAAVDNYLRARDDNPVVVVPTGGGKSFIMAEIIRKYVSTWSDTRILNVVHVKELVEQNAKKLKSIYDGDVGIYSAGLKSRDLHQNVVFAGIQSIYNKDVGHVDLLFVDEAHRIPKKGEGMYQQLVTRLKETNPNLRVIGFTATDYRLDSGKICSKSGVLNGVAYECSVSRLIDEGYLSDIISVGGKKKIDTSGVKITAGDYNKKELALAANDDEVVISACREIVQRGADRLGWVVFASGKEHAENIQSVISSYGYSCEVITDDTPAADRAAYIEAYKNKQLRCLVNVNILSEGFDAPHTDLIALLRPTQSAGLYYQQVGRGLRTDPGKGNCLLLDFAGNVATHGCIDNLHIPKKGETKGQAPVRECPDCQTVSHISKTICGVCGYMWPVAERESKHNGYASDSAVLSNHIKPEWVNVDKIVYSSHTSKKSKSVSMKVTYHCGLRLYSEWVCVEHSGYPKAKARAWWSARSGKPLPTNVDEAVAGATTLLQPQKIMIVNEKKYDKIQDYQFN